MQQTALNYLAHGLAVLPAERAAKKPAQHLRWKQYTKRLPTEVEVNAWFANGPDALCLLTGAASGNLEAIDFDQKAELFEAWASRIDPALLARLIIQATQSGGLHVIYRCLVAICGNLKLAQRKGSDGKIMTLIETRGEGGLFLCTPTPGYELKQGSFTDIPVITEEERDALLQAAWELNEYIAVVDGAKAVPKVSSPSAGGPRPGDDFNARGNIAGLLQAHGWTLTKGGENSYWRRPGKTSGWSATLKDRVFYVFSSNASPFEPNRGYSAFAVYAILNHNGDWERAATTLRQGGYGGTTSPVAATPAGVDVSAIVAKGAATTASRGDVDEEPKRQVPPDPGPLPDELLRVPGFISELMDYTMATAPYPNIAISFAAALALLSFLTGRKVRDPGDNRTNIYLLGLADSGDGKEHPRKVNAEVVYRVELGECLGERSASGEGLQDALRDTPAMLFQTDEIDGVLQTMKKDKEARHEAMLNGMLILYSKSNGKLPVRRKAGQKRLPDIDQPHLVIFGTAIPKHYYDALSERMLTNGFFARTLVIESSNVEGGQDPQIIDPPASILSVARWWADFHQGKGNLQDFHPEPRIVT